MAGYIKEKIWHESQKLHPQKDGSLIFEAEVAGTEEIKSWILSWGKEATILEPAELKAKIKSEVIVMIQNNDEVVAHEGRPRSA